MKSKTTFYLGLSLLSTAGANALQGIFQTSYGAIREFSIVLNLVAGFIVLGYWLIERPDYTGNERPLGVKILAIENILVGIAVGIEGLLLLLLPIIGLIGVIVVGLGVGFVWLGKGLWEGNTLALAITIWFSAIGILVGFVGFVFGLGVPILAFYQLWYLRRLNVTSFFYREELPTQPAEPVSGPVLPEGETPVFPRARPLSRLGLPSGIVGRKEKDILVYGLCLACVVIAVVPLASILIEVVVNGAPAITPEFLTSGPGIIGQAGGGIGNAIQGTLILVGLASVPGIIIGVLAGIYLAEFGEVDVLGSPLLTRINRSLSGSLRFLNNVLAEFPSIVIGILAYSIVVLALRSFSTIAGATALAVIMLPTVTRTTEESIKLVPGNIRDAAAALGIPKWRSTLSVVLSTSRNGVITGVLLAVARIAGETAPLILTVLGSSLFFNCNIANPIESCGYALTHPVDALPLRIWRLALLPYDYARQQGWGAALVLIVIVLVINVTVRFATRGKYSAMSMRQ